MYPSFSPGGTPALDGDFIGSIQEFTFTVLDDKPCVDVFIFRDDIFEGDEEFRVEFQFFRSESGSTVSSLPGVTVRPMVSTVTIEDANSKCAVL